MLSFYTLRLLLGILPFSNFSFSGLFIVCLSPFPAPSNQILLKHEVTFDMLWSVSRTFTGDMTTCVSPWYNDLYFALIWRLVFRPDMPNCVSPWYDDLYFALIWIWRLVFRPDMNMTTCFSPWYDDLCFALIWRLVFLPDMTTRISPWFDDLCFALIWWLVFLPDMTTCIWPWYGDLRFALIWPIGGWLAVKLGESTHLCAWWTIITWPSPLQ